MDVCMWSLMVLMCSMTCVGEVSYLESLSVSDEMLVVRVPMDDVLLNDVSLSDRCLISDSSDFKEFSLSRMCRRRWSKVLRVSMFCKRPSKSILPRSSLHFATESTCEDMMDVSCCMLACWMERVLRQM